MVIARCPLARSRSLIVIVMAVGISPLACCSLNPLPLSSSNSLTRSDSAAAGSHPLRCFSSAATVSG